MHFDQCNYSEAENIRLENGARIKRGFDQLLEAWNGQHSVNQAKSMIYDLLDQMANDQKASINDAAVASCVRYMEEHYSDPDLDVEALCGISFISASSLQRAFARCLAMSPKQYLTRLRMDRALKLLASNELSVKEISYACGFTDEKYFSRAFKKRFGYPPSRLKSDMIV